MIQERKARGAGFGASRFLVRGPGALPLDRAAALRPSYNEYPERFALNPMFPRPGRRGGSRPPQATGTEAPEPGDIVLEPPIYPDPRLRIGDPTGGSIYGGSMPESYLEGQEIRCEDIGDSVVFSPNAQPGVARVLASSRIARPFKVVHISYWSENTTPDQNTDLGLKILVSDDNNVAADFNTTGDNVVRLSGAGPGGGLVLEPFNVTQHHYPNAVFGPGKYLKVAFNNPSVGAIDTYVVIDIRYVG